MSAGFQGSQPLSTWGDPYNSTYSIVKSILSGIHTSILAQVIKVTNTGGVEPVGYVDLQPLVNQVTGAGDSVPQGIIHNVPYFRLQGGKNAIIIDPEVGDIGDAIFCERDISEVISNRKQSDPGSGRQYNISDGLFMCGFINQVPTQYIQFNQAGVKVFSPGRILVQATGDVDVVAGGAASVTASDSVSVSAGTSASVSAGTSVDVTAGTTASVTAQDSASITAPDISLNGNVTVTGNLGVDGTMTNNGTNVGKTHEHNVPGVQSGSSTVVSDPPH